MDHDGIGQAPGRSRPLRRGHRRIRDGRAGADRADGGGWRRHSGDRRGAAAAAAGGAPAAAAPGRPGLRRRRERGGRRRHPRPDRDAPGAPARHLRPRQRALVPGELHRPGRGQPGRRHPAGLGLRGPALPRHRRRPAAARRHRGRLVPRRGHEPPRAQPRQRRHRQQHQRAGDLRRRADHAADPALLPAETVRRPARHRVRPAGGQYQLPELAALLQLPDELGLRQPDLRVQDLELHVLARVELGRARQGVAHRQGVRPRGRLRGEPAPPAARRQRPRLLDQGRDRRDRAVRARLLDHLRQRRSAQELRHRRLVRRLRLRRPGAGRDGPRRRSHRPPPPRPASDAQASTPASTRWSGGPTPPASRG